MSHLRISRKMQFAPIIPKASADLVMALEPVEALRILGEFGNSDIQVIVNTRPVYPMAVLSGECKYPPVNEILNALRSYSRRLWTIDATKIALELGNSILANIVMLGAIAASSTLDINENILMDVLAESLPAKILEKNIQAFQKGQSGLLLQ